MPGLSAWDELRQWRLCGVHVRMTIVAFDNETWSFQQGLQLPPVVCVSYAEIVPDARDGQPYAKVGARGVLDKKDGLDAVFHWLRNGAALVGAETAFDVLTLVVSASKVSAQAHKELLRLFVDAYEQDRITDVLTRQ